MKSTSDSQGTSVAVQPARRQLRVKQIRSMIGVDWRQRLNLQGLGLGRVGKTVEVANTPSFRGAIKKVLHLVTVEEI